MNVELLLAHFNRICEAPNAVPSLRRFILDLAVRGKLVEQDSSDEPASFLLKRIHAAKVRLGRIARKEDAAVNTESYQNTPLPNGWAWASLADLVVVLNGRAYSQNELLEQGTPVLRVGNLFTSKHWYYSDLRLDEDKYCDAGDLIFAWSASFGPFIWQGPKVIYHYHIWKLALHSECDLDKLYVYWLLSQRTQVIKDAGHGISMLHMTKEKMEKLSLPIPPLAEQRRIVAKVDELMALCDRLEVAQRERESRRDRLTAAIHHHLNNGADAEVSRSHARFFIGHFPRLTTRHDQIKQLRQTVLNLAVRGKLVRQHPDDEPATELLKRIQTEISRSVESGENKERKKLQLSANKNAPFDIPRTWAWVTLDQIVLGFHYGTSMKCSYERAGEPVLRIPNIVNGGTNVEDLKFTALAKREADELRLRLGDILMVRSNGSLDLVGRPALVGANAVGYCYAGYLIRVRISAIHLVAPYVLLALNSAHVRNQIEIPIRTTVGLKNVNATELSNLEIPLPPLAEQSRIVAKVDELMTLCDRLEGQLIDANAKSRGLLEAVLHHALADASEATHPNKATHMANSPMANSPVDTAVSAI